MSDAVYASSFSSFNRLFLFKRLAKKCRWTVLEVVLLCFKHRLPAAINSSQSLSPELGVSTATECRCMDHRLAGLYDHVNSPSTMASAVVKTISLDNRLTFSAYSAQHIGTISISFHLKKLTQYGRDFVPYCVSRKLQYSHVLVINIHVYICLWDYNWLFFMISWHYMLCKCIVYFQTYVACH